MSRLAAHPSNESWKAQNRNQIISGFLWHPWHLCHFGVSYAPKTWEPFPGGFPSLFRVILMVILISWWCLLFQQVA